MVLNVKHNNCLVHLVGEPLLKPSVSMTCSFPESLQFPMDVTDVTLPVLLQRVIREMTQPGTKTGVVKYMQFTEELLAELPKAEVKNGLHTDG